MASPSLQFARSQRLLKPGDFKQVFNRPCRSTDSYLTILATPNGLEWGRLGLAISKKNVKLAVQRNRIKRLIRDSFRHHQATLAGYDVVVMVRKGVADLSNAEIRAALPKHWRRIQKQCAG